MTSFLSRAALAWCLCCGIGLATAHAQVPPGRFQPDPRLPAEVGVPYVILTSEALAPSFARLAEWKRGTGMPVQIIAIEWLQKSPYYPGVDLPERIYRLLQDLRMNWRTRWVLLGGDVDIIPVQRIRAYRGAMGGNQISSDVYYADVLPDVPDDRDKIADYGWNGNGDRFIGDVRDDGFDLTAELYVGRVPVETPAEVEAFVDKWLEYVEPRGKDTTWLNRALVVGAHEFEERQKAVQGLFQELGGAGFGVELVAERKPDPIQAITDEMNKGYAFLDFFCHGCPTHFWACDDHTSWGVLQARTLKNDGRTPVVFANSCDTTEFEKDDCLAEAIVIQPRSGAIAYLGYSSLSFGSSVNQEIYRRVFGGDCPELGRALAEAKQSVANDTWVGQILHLIGEPEMWVRTAPPQSLKLTVERLVQHLPGRVHVADAAGKPIRHARVLVEAPGVWLSGRSDAEGVVRLPAPEKAGSARLVAIAQNGLRSEKKLTIESKPPADALPAARPTLAVDDSGDEPGGEGGAGRLHGNGQQDLNPGETVRLKFTWARDLPLPAGTLQLAFDQDPFVAPVGEPVIADDRLSAVVPVHVQARVPSWHQAWAVLSFQAASGGDPWTWTFRQPIEGPSVTCCAVTVDDAEGNRDRRVGWEDAGKRLRFSIGLYNSGTQKAAGLSITATTADPSVTLVKGTIAFGALPIEEPVHPKDKTFEFQLADDYDGHPVAFVLAIEDARRNRWEGRLVFTVPPAPPLLPHAECGVKRVAVSWVSGGSPGVTGYHVYRGTAEKGPFARLTEQPVRATRFPDPTVKPMTAYYYAVSAVTADGLESRLSAPVRAHTLSPLPRGKSEGK